MYLILNGFVAFRKIQQLFHASSRHFPPDFLPLLKSATNFEGLVTQTTVAALHLSSSLSLCLRRKRGRETERERERERERRPRLRPTRKGRPWRPSSLGRGRSSIRLGSLLGTTYSTQSTPTFSSEQNGSPGMQTQGTPLEFSVISTTPLYWVGLMVGCLGWVDCDRCANVCLVLHGQIHEIKILLNRLVFLARWWNHGQTLTVGGTHNSKSTQHR